MKFKNYSNKTFGVTEQDSLIILMDIIQISSKIYHKSPNPNYPCFYCTMVREEIMKLYKNQISFIGNEPITYLNFNQMAV